MAVNIAAITFTCVDPHEAASWAEALRKSVAATVSPGSAAVIAAVPLLFRRGERTGHTGNRTHPDRTTMDFDAEADRLRDLGATEVRRNRWHSTGPINFRDIEGDEFDLVAGWAHAAPLTQLNTTNRPGPGIGTGPGTHASTTGAISCPTC
ncbi:VOC family protein [Nocardioides sp. YIM 152315]|uniref:VOC family protein n=1 Tax=Nocardioides sp. YIM 152315 TaxID=3031760 RepID=UPI0023DAEB17|nr:VOC family protein [Nocardioides sp. YIM 152315]MDF1604087.1 VOC family protein [Nocardioides sp. YIM 152315]